MVGSLQNPITSVEVIGTEMDADVVAAAIGCVVRCVGRDDVVDILQMLGLTVPRDRVLDALYVAHEACSDCGVTMVRGGVVPAGLRCHDSRGRCTSCARRWRRDAPKRTIHSG